MTNKIPTLAVVVALSGTVAAQENPSFRPPTEPEDCETARVQTAFYADIIRTATDYAILLTEDDDSSTGALIQSMRTIRSLRTILLPNFQLAVEFQTEACENAGGQEQETETVFWESIANSTDPADFEAYLEQFSEGVFRRLAKNRVETLRGSAEAARERLVSFLEGTDVFWTWQRWEDNNDHLDSEWPYFLEANIFPHLIVYQNFTNLLTTVDEEATPRTGWSVSGTPAVRVRMLREQSNPVRTPSYMPRVNIQSFHVWSNRGQGEMELFAADTPDEESDEEPVVFTILETHFILGHHSNGQDGCLATTQARQGPENECSLLEGALTADIVNRRNGGFSTNYWRAGLTYSHNRWAEDVPNYLAPADWELRVRADVEQHFKTDPDILGYYSVDRANIEVASAFRDVGICNKRLEVSGGGTWNMDGRSEAVTPQGSFSAQVSCFWSESGGWGLFGRYYKGQDYYNVGFMDSIERLHVGITYSPAGFFRFGG